MWSSFFNFPTTMRFEQQYRCRSMALVGKDNLENGGKIVLPTSALDMLARLNIEYPMLFEITSPQRKVTHCGVQEFVAEEGFCYLPYWMMQLLLINEGDIIAVRNVSLPKGTYVKLQPVDESFLEVSNPKAVLERELRGWAALTQGDIICITYNKRKYEISVLEIKPVNPTNAISIIETDVIVDFAPSQEQERRARERAQAAQAASAPKPIAQPSSSQPGPSTPQSPAVTTPQQPQKEPEKFPGTGRTLRGGVVATPSTPSTSSTATSTSAPSPSLNAALNRYSSSSIPTSKGASSSSSTAASSAQPAKPLSKSGGLVFGAPGAKPKPQPASTSGSASSSSSSSGASTSGSTSGSTSSTSTENKFVPFSGQGRSLRG